MDSLNTLPMSPRWRSLGLKKALVDYLNCGKVIYPVATSQPTAIVSIEGNLLLCGNPGPREHNIIHMKHSIDLCRRNELRTLNFREYYANLTRRLLLKTSTFSLQSTQLRNPAYTPELFPSALPSSSQLPAAVPPLTPLSLKSNTNNFLISNTKEMVTLQIS